MRFPFLISMTVELLENDKTIISQQKKSITVAAFKVNTEKFGLKIPSKSGEYTLIARIVYNSEVVESVRDISVK
jgi:hypothetical protein